MTIKYLWAEIKKRYPSCIKNLPLSVFSEMIFTIDGEAFISPYRVKARERAVKETDFIINDVDEDMVDVYWYTMVLQGLLRFTDNGITPTIVFDGKAPKAKTPISEERVKKIHDDVDEANRLKESLRNDDILSIKENDPRLVTLKKIESRMLHLPPEKKYRLKAFLKELGFPVITANDGIEAERLISAFCNEGVSVSGVSTDGDCLAHAINMLITDIFYEGKVLYARVVFMEELLKLMGNITQKQFTEICIISGCDYNGHQGIKGKGFFKVHEMIKKYKSFRKFPREFTNANKKQIKELNFKECKDLFGPISPSDSFDWKSECESLNISEDDCSDLFSVRVDRKKIRDLLESMDLSKLEDRLYYSLNKLNEPKFCSQEIRRKIFYNKISNKKEESLSEEDPEIPTEINGSIKISDKIDMNIIRGLI